jgi:hypothetical protein
MERKLPSEHDAARIWHDAWQAAARINPMLLAQVDTGRSVDKYQELIRTELSKGLSASEIEKKVGHCGRTGANKQIGCRLLDKQAAHRFGQALASTFWSHGG